IRSPRGIALPFPLPRIDGLQSSDRRSCAVADHTIKLRTCKERVMTYTEMLEELKKLTPTERLTLMEAALRIMREELQQHAQPMATSDRAQQLAAAAQALLLDYTTD